MIGRSYLIIHYIALTSIFRLQGTVLGTWCRHLKLEAHEYDRSAKEQRRMRKLHIRTAARDPADSRIKRELPRPVIKGPKSSRVTGSFMLDLTVDPFFFHVVLAATQRAFLNLLM